MFDMIPSNKMIHNDVWYAMLGYDICYDIKKEKGMIYDIIWYNLIWYARICIFSDKWYWMKWYMK